MFAARRCRLGIRVFLRSPDNGRIIFRDGFEPRSGIIVRHSHERPSLHESLLMRTCSRSLSQTANPCSRLYHCERLAREVDDVDWTRDLDSVGPVAVVLRYSRRTALVKMLTDRQLDDISDVIDLANDAVDRRDNVGVDEFPPKDELQEALLKNRTALFSVRNTAENATTNKSSLLAAILIRPCPAARSLRPRLASVQVIATEEISRDLWATRDLTRLALKLASSLGEGFVACVTFVYYECFRHLSAWTDEGFVVTACLPMVGLLKPSTISKVPSSVSSSIIGEKGATTTASSSYLLYRKLENVGPAVAASDDEIKAYADSLCSTSYDSYVDEKSFWSSRSPPKLDYFPVVMTLPRSGFRVKWRFIEWSDLDMYHETFLEAAKSGQGYRVEEVPTRRFFVWACSEDWNFVIEDATTGDCMAVICVTSSKFSRTKKLRYLCDADLVIKPGYRNLRRGLGADLEQMGFSIAVDLGFRACLTTTALDNIGLVRSATGVGVIAVGSVPGILSSQDRGKSTDVMILYRSLADVKSFKDLTCS